MGESEVWKGLLQCHFFFYVFDRYIFFQKSQRLNLAGNGFILLENEMFHERHYYSSFLFNKFTK